MLDAMMPEQMDEWIAFGLIEPFGDAWRQTAVLAAEVNNSVAAEMKDLRSADDYLPPQARGIDGAKVNDGLMSPEQYEKVSAARQSRC